MSNKRSQLVLQYVPMVDQIARRLASRLPPNVEYDDIRHIGLLGLISALDRVSQREMSNLDAYLRIRIQGAIFDELRVQDWIPRSVRNRASQLELVTQVLAERLQRKPTSVELAQHLGISIDELLELRRKSLILQSAPMDSTLLENLSGDALSPLEELMTQEAADHLRQVVNNLNERNRHIIESYYYQGRSFRQIAGDLELTEARISQIHSEVRRQLQRRMSSLKEQ